MFGGPSSPGPPTGLGHPGTGSGAEPRQTSRRARSVRRCVRRAGRSRDAARGKAARGSAARAATGRECPQGAMMGLGLRVLPWRTGPWCDSGPCGGSGPPGRRVGEPPPWVVWFRGWGGGGRSGVGGCVVRGRVVSSGQSCTVASMVSRRARPTSSELRHGPIGPRTARFMETRDW